MPYKSRAQAAKFHELLKQGKISKATVDEFDKASKGMSLPERVKTKASPKKGRSNRQRRQGGGFKPHKKF